MSLPWFPFNIKAYVADTMRLATEGHGAYLLLMLDYYSTGAAPPDDDDVLASITKLPVKAWKTHRRVIEPFFRSVGGVWLHDRIENEIWDAERLHGLAVAKAKHAADKRWGKPSGIPQASRKDALSMPSASPKQSFKDAQEQVQKIDGGGDARATPAPRKSLISEEAFTVSGDVMQAMGLHRDDPRSYGAPMQVQAWLNGGWPADVILVGVQRAMANRKGDPPGTLKYFEKAIARQHAEMSRPLPVAIVQPGEKFDVQSNRGSPESLGDVARRQAENGIQFGPRPTGLREPGSGPIVRLLSQG